MRIGRGKPASMRMSWSSMSGSWSSSRRRASFGYASQKRSSTRHRTVTACLTRRTWPGETKCGISTNGIVCPAKTTSCSLSQVETVVSRPAHVSPSLESSTRYWSLRLLTWSISAASTLSPHRHGHAVSDRQEGGAQVVALLEALVEAADQIDRLLRPLVRGIAGRRAAAHEDVVDEQQAAGPQQPDRLVEVGLVASFRAVDEREVEAAVLELREARGGVLQAQVGLEAAALQVLARGGVALRVDLEACDVRAAAGQVQRGHADRGADLDRVLRPGRGGQHLEQAAGDVVHDRDVVALAVLAHLEQERVGLRLERGHVLADGWFVDQRWYS